MQMCQSVGNFIILLLADHKAHTLLIIFTQRSAEGIHLVVFTAQAYHQHRPGIGVTHHILQHGAGILMILSEL
ncbi:hypothetical protein D3C81_2224150 [compost metagenome]